MEKCTNYVEPIIKLGERFSEKFTEVVEILNKLLSFETEEEREQYIETLPNEIKKYFMQEMYPKEKIKNTYFLDIFPKKEQQKE